MYWGFRYGFYAATNGVSNSFLFNMKRLDHREDVVIVRLSEKAKLDHAGGGSRLYGPMATLPLYGLFRWWLWP